MKSREPKIVITGMSTINPLGDTLDQYIDNLLHGKSGIVNWQSINTDKLQCKVGGDLSSYDFNKALQLLENVADEACLKRAHKIFKTTTFSTKSAVICALRAFEDANLFKQTIDLQDFAVITAGHNFNSNYIYRNFVQYQDEPEFIDALSSVEGIDPNIPGVVSEVLLASGPSYTIGGACASGNLALREAVRDIKGGEYDQALVVGPVFDVSEYDLYASEYINATVANKEFQKDPTQASRPFDVGRSGFVYSHGAGALIVESEKSALARGARIYAEVIDVVANSNACHLPLPSSEMQARLLRKLIHRNNISAKEINYINCHATGTPAGDLEEIKAIQQIWHSDLKKDLKINAPKSMLGHVCWSAPIVETIGGILQMHRGKLHPTINIDTLDPEIDLDVVPNQAIDYNITYMIKNSFGFGGINCISLIGRYGK